MEKKKLTQEMLDQIDPNSALTESGFEFITDLLPYRELEKAALELVDATLILDPLGIVYQNYSFELEWCYVVLKYCTNIDVDGLDKEALYRAFGVITENLHWGENKNVRRIADMYDNMREIVSKRHEAEYSMSYKLGILMDALTANAEGNAKEMGDRLIDLISKTKEADKLQQTPVLKMFAKKE